jgi:hypothetical protein
MDQAQLVQAIGEQLDALESLFNWLIVSGIAVAWAAFELKSTIRVFGHDLDRRRAFLATGGAFMLATAAAVLLFLRIGDLLAALDREHMLEGLTVLCTHSWTLNPFAYFGNGGVSRSHSALGTAALIVSWWLVNASLHTLTDQKKSRATLTMLTIFVLLGVVVLVAIARAHYIAVTRAKEALLPIAAGLENAFHLRSDVASGGVLVGGVAFLLIVWGHEALMKIHRLRAGA